MNKQLPHERYVKWTEVGGEAVNVAIKDPS